MRFFLTPYFLLVCTLLFLNSCKNGFNTKNSEGVIHYQINYLDSEKDNPIIALLPQTMDLKFNGLKLSNELTGDMGLFAIRFVVNGEDSTTSTLIRVLGKKYTYKAQLGESIPGYNAFENLVIKYDSTSYKKIAGVDCYMAEANFIDDKQERQIITMYYTEKLAVPNGNAYNPYSNVPGVLMSFRVKFNGINMEFIAQSIEYKDVDEKEFSIPEDYEHVDRNGIEMVMQKYLPQK